MEAEPVPATQPVAKAEPTVAATPAVDAAEPERDARPKAAAKPKATPRAKAGAKPKAAAKPKPKAKAAAKPKATAARRKAAAPRTFEPTEAAEAAAAGADERAGGAIPLAKTPPKTRPAPTYPRPKPVSEGAPGIGRTGYRDKTEPAPGRKRGAEIVTGAMKTAGDVAQAGLALGRQALKRVVGRVPKP
jgi:hypothetical protein